MANLKTDKEKSPLASLHRMFRDSLSRGRRRFVGMNTAPMEKVEVGKGKKHLAKPLVVSGGPTVRNLKCVMCQGYIKVGLQYARCECGETYHVTCLTRMGFCPVCNMQWPTEKISDITRNNGDMSLSPYAKKLNCPSCGNNVSIYDLECSCGAIFVRENDSFLCPECGGRVSLGEMVCAGCGEVFRSCDIVACPSCGRNFDAMGGPCECGTFLGDACPECGADLKQDDGFCSKCGCRIESI